MAKNPAIWLQKVLSHHVFTNVSKHAAAHGVIPICRSAGLFQRGAPTKNCLSVSHSPYLVCSPCANSQLRNRTKRPAIAHFHENSTSHHELPKLHASHKLCGHTRRNAEWRPMLFIQQRQPPGGCSFVPLSTPAGTWQCYPGLQCSACRGAEMLESM